MSAYALPGPALGQTPTLPGASGGQDSMYAAQEAQLRADIMRRYSDILQQLGTKNAAGDFIPGEVELQAKRQETELERNKGLAAEEVTSQAQQQGTLFSGLRAKNTARAQHPFVQGIADLAVDTPRQLGQLYQGAGRTLEDYTIQNNLLLADAAARAAAKAMSQAGFATAPDTGTPAAPPPLPPAPPPPMPIQGAPLGPPLSWTPSFRAPEGYNFKSRQLEGTGY